MKSEFGKRSSRLKLFALPCLLVASTVQAEVVFFETFGSADTQGGTSGYATLGDNRSVITAAGFRTVASTGTTSTNFELGIFRPSNSRLSDRAGSGVTGASGLNVLRFTSQSAGLLTSQWYQFNAIPLTGHEGDTLNIDFLFYPLSLTLPGLTTLNDLFTLSVSWDGEVFEDVPVTFANGNSTNPESWKTVTGTALVIESESAWLRITANPSTQGAFPEMFFDDLKLSVSGSAVPEPSAAAALGGIAALGFVLLRRRRHRL